MAALGGFGPDGVGRAGLLLQTGPDDVRAIVFIGERHAQLCIGASSGVDLVEGSDYLPD